MPLKNIPLTKSDFDTLPWQGVIDECKEKECYIYDSKFFARAREAEAAGNEKAQEIYILLGAICSLHLRTENKDEPFGPMIVTQSGRSAILDDITDDHIKVLQEIVGEVQIQSFEQGSLTSYGLGKEISEQRVLLLKHTLNQPPFWRIPKRGHPVFIG